MSLSGHFKSRYVTTHKITGREIKTAEDFPTARIRHSDGSHATYQGGKMKPGTLEAAPATKFAKKDVPGGEGQFYKPTDVATIVTKSKNGETDTAGETETTSQVRKRIDVNARAMKL